MPAWPPHWELLDLFTEVVPGWKEHFGDTQNHCCERCGKVLSAPRRAAGAGAPAELGPGPGCSQQEPEGKQRRGSSWGVPGREKERFSHSRQSVSRDQASSLTVPRVSDTSPGKIPQQPAVQSEALAWPEDMCWGLPLVLRDNLS